MNEKELINLALEAGFANAAIVDTGDIVFLPAFRPLCEENQCGKYGVNYSCPPDCGTTEEMRERIVKWKKALVLQTLWDVDDPMDSGELKPAKKQHNRLTRQLINQSGKPGLMVGASGCSLCDPCALVSGEPCRFPELKYSCMSAYCVFVKDLADKCGMDYDCGPNITALFSMFCFS